MSFHFSFTIWNWEKNIFLHWNKTMHIGWKSDPSVEWLWGKRSKPKPQVTSDELDELINEIPF